MFSIHLFLTDFGLSLTLVEVYSKKKNILHEDELPKLYIAKYVHTMLNMNRTLRL